MKELFVTEQIENGLTTAEFRCLSWECEIETEDEYDENLIHVSKRRETRKFSEKTPIQNIKNRQQFCRQCGGQLEFCRIVPHLPNW